MATMKSKKGNPFEKLIAYNLQLAGYTVIRPDINLEGVDLIAKKGDLIFYIECKNRKRLAWNELKKILDKTKSKLTSIYHKPLLVFKSNRQPILVMHYFSDTYYIREFQECFGIKEIKPYPKGYYVTQKEI